MKGKYTYSFSDDCFENEDYDTEEEALAAARKEAKEYENSDRPPTEVYIGIVGEKWKPTIDGESIIDMLRDEAYEEGGEYAEDYLEDVPKEQRDELTEILTLAFTVWAKEHGYEPNFFPIENVKEYKL